MPLVLLLLACYALLLWPLLATLGAHLVGAPPARVQIGAGPPLVRWWHRGTEVALAPLPLASMLEWRDGRVPRLVPLLTHGAVFALALVASGWLAPDLLLATARFLARLLTLRDTGAGGLLGGLSSAWPHGDARPLHALCVGLWAMSGWNLALALAQQLSLRLVVALHLGVLVILASSLWSDAWYFFG